MRQPYITVGRSGKGTGWHFVPATALPRQPQDVFVDKYVREALIRLNPAIAAQPDRADEVIHKLRAIVLSVRSDGLIRANEEFTAWLRGGRSISKAAAKMAVLVNVPERIQAICADIARHFREKVEPNGFRAMVVTFDQESCLLYKGVLDRHLPSEASEIVISVSGKEREDARYRPYKRDRDAEEQLLDRFRDPNDPLQILVVTAKLLTGGADSRERPRGRPTTQRRVPQTPARPGQGPARSREGDAARGGRGSRQGCTDRALRGSAQPGYADHGRAHCQ